MALEQQQNYFDLHQMQIWHYVIHFLIVSLKNTANKLKLKYCHLMLLSKMLPIKIVSTYYAHIQNITENAQKNGSYRI